MTSRAESAAQTRQALLDAAAALLDRGGPDAVTLRAVGDGAGVSRSAAYRHFTDKNALLMALATDAWTFVGDALTVILGDESLGASDAIGTALAAFSGFGHARPHLYRLMFAPSTTSSASTTAAAGRAQDVFIDLVGRVVDESAAHPIAGVLLAATHGLTDLDLSGHLPAGKWGADRHRLSQLLVAMIPSNDERGD